MATLNTVRAVLKDSTMRQHAGVIQTEVEKMMDDIRRLDRRISNLQNHFNSAITDMTQIRISTDKILKTGIKIDNLHFQDETPAADLAAETASRTLSPRQNS